jgi:type IV pilus assembly protein PilY1
VTNPRGLSESGLAAKVKWEFPSAGDTSTQAKMGQTVGRALVVRLPSGSYVVLVTSGYNNTADGKGRVWMLNPETGAVVHEFVVSAGTLGAESGLAHILGFAEGDGSVRYVYGGDLLGNLWKFDLVSMAAPTLVAVLKDSVGNTQPVTAEPELLWYEGKRIVLVGTGRLLDITDFGSSGVQSFYAIADGATLGNARSSLVEQVYTKATNTVTSNAVNWATGRGWFIDLPAGEQANTRPVIARSSIAFVTNVAGSTDCSASSYFYVLDVTSGSSITTDGSVMSVISTTANSSSPNAWLGGPPGSGSGGGGGGGGPGTCDAITYNGQSTDGKAYQKVLDKACSISASKNAWRAVRRR